MTESELKQFVGKPCWFAGDILEIRKKSDATLKAVENGNVVVEHCFAGTSKVPIANICSIRRKDI